MIRTQIQFEEAQHQQIRRLAQSHQISMSEVVRRLIRQSLALGLDQDPPRKAGALLELAGIGQSALGDLGRRHDEYLAEDFGL